MGAGFASSDRFLADVAADRLRPGYVFLGDEAFHAERCRRALVTKFAPDDLREFCLHDLDLA